MVPAVSETPRLDEGADPLRYDGHRYDPHDTVGILVDWIPSECRVLDVGCGTGSLSRWIVEKRRVELVGLEPSPTRALEARRRGIDARELRFDRAGPTELGLFDLVLFSDVLEHLVDPSSALLRARNLLRPGGMVLASVPNVAHWTVRWNLLCGRFDSTSLGIMDRTHLRWYTAKTARELFESSGYRVLAMRGAPGTWMPEYRRLPWKAIPKPLRKTIIRSLAKHWPTVFACQHVIRAVPVDPTHATP